MKTVGNAMIEGGISAFVLSLFHNIGKVAEEKGIELLKSKMFGVGTNDEHLFLSACAYALEQKMLTEAELSKVCKVLNSYESSQRSRIIGIIGKEESEVSVETPKLDKDGNLVTEKKTGKVVNQKTTEKTNLKGARMLAMLAKLSEEEIKKVLDASGSSDSLLFNMKQKAADFAKAVEAGGMKRDAEKAFPSETWLEKMAREAKAKRGII